MADSARPNEARETMIAQTRNISCDGGDGAYGHPKVYLKIAGTQVVCPYCSRQFVLAAGVGESGH